MKNKSIIVCWSIVLILNSFMVHASMLEDISQWWNNHALTDSAKTIATPSTHMYLNQTNDAQYQNQTNQTSPDLHSVSDLKCIAPTPRGSRTCTMGERFLCVNSPGNSGVATGLFQVRGTIDRDNYVVGSIRVALQHNYTKEIHYVPTDISHNSHCWQDGLSGFCLDNQGLFSTNIRLNEYGPYTISVSANRLNGEVSEEKIEISKVMPLSLTESSIVFTPNIYDENIIDSDYVYIDVNMLGDCTFCDFIGASTGSLSIMAQNNIVSERGYQKVISCHTNSEQGGSGLFRLGVPVIPGENKITVSICNDAVSPDCPSIGPITFNNQVHEQEAAFQIISPNVNTRFLSSIDYPKIPFKFKLGSLANQVSIRFNQNQPELLSANQNNIFDTVLDPQVGLNLITISSPEYNVHETWQFYWGAWHDLSDSDHQITISDALGLDISSPWIEKMMMTYVKSFFTNNGLKQLLDMKLNQSISQESSLEGDSAANQGQDEVLSSVAPSFCSNEVQESDYIITVGNDFKLGHVDITHFEIDDDLISMNVDIQDMQFLIYLGPDFDHDGVANEEPLPLKIGFHKLSLPIRIYPSQEYGNWLILGSKYDDCAYVPAESYLGEFSDNKYCEGFPALIVPDGFLGNATKYGHFFHCEIGLTKSNKAKKACKAFNNLGDQVITVSESILDTINKQIYCSGTMYLSAAFNDGINMDVPMGASDCSDCDGLFDEIVPSINLPIQIKMTNMFEINKKHLSATADISVSVQDTHDDAHFIYSQDSQDYSKLNHRDRDIHGMINLDLINAFLYASTTIGDGKSKKGLLDIDIHELFFEKMGFNFTDECLNFDPIPGLRDEKSALCNLRPRSGHIFGQVPSQYGYLDDKDPIMISIRGNPEFAPRLVISDPDKWPDTEVTGDSFIVELQLSDLQMHMYALKTNDAAEKLPGDFPRIKKEKKGKVAIRSMRGHGVDPWDDPLVSFNLSMILGVHITIDDADSSGNRIIRAQLLGDQSHFMMMPIMANNATIIDGKKLQANLDQLIRMALGIFSTPDMAITKTIPGAIEMLLGDDLNHYELPALFDIHELYFGDQGLSVSGNHQTNSLHILMDIIFQ